MEDLSTSLGATAPAETPIYVVPRVMEGASVAGALAEGRTPTVWNRLKDSVGAAQSATVGMLRSQGRSVAGFLGASESTATTVGSSLPVVLVLLVVAAVAAFVFKGGKVFGKRSIKL